jgi:hypothetical protein
MAEEENSRQNFKRSKETEDNKKDIDFVWF